LIVNGFNNTEVNAGGVIAGITSAAAIITLISIAGCVFSLVRMKMRESNVPRSKLESVSQETFITGETRAEGGWKERG
jgi:hypothetical protein